MTELDQRQEPDAAMKNDLDLLSAIYRDADDEVPPPALDDAIRSSARKAVDARPQPVKKSWVANWTVPPSIAATVVLTVSIGTLAINENPQLAPPPPAATAVKPAVGDAATNGAAPADDHAALEVTRSVLPPRAKKQEAPGLFRRQASDAAVPSPAPAASEFEMQPATRGELNLPDTRSRADASAAAFERHMPAAALAAPMPSSTVGQEKSVAAESAPESPEQWMERIRLLRTQGRTKEADEALKNSVNDIPATDYLPT